MSRDVTRLRGQEVKSSLVAEDVSCRKKPMSCVVSGCSSRSKPREKHFFLVPKVVVVHGGEKCQKKLTVKSGFQLYVCSWSGGAESANIN